VRVVDFEGGAAMQISLPRLRAGLFGLTLVLFSMPFVTLSCPGAEVTFSGIELAIGKTVQEPQMFDAPKTKRIDGEPVALAALICAVIGVAAAFVSAGPSRILGASAGLVGAVLLLVLKSGIEAEVKEHAMGLFEVRYGIGYWGAFLGYAAGFLSSFARNPDREPSALPMPALVDEQPGA
jgi:hypothetical protein